MGINKSTSLRTAFWRFLFMLLIGLLGAVVIPFTIMIIAVTCGVATYADYSEIQAKELATIITAAPELSEVQIPTGLEYALLDKNCQPLTTTLDDTELELAIQYATTGVSDRNLNKQYLLVTRENEYVVLQYYIGSQFTNDWMNEYLPSPDILMTVLIGINCIVVCIFLTTKFAKNLQLQLIPLFEATSEVSKQNLDFKVGQSEIKEFEDVLRSFSNMKDSMKNSLEQQWKIEQMQREQIAALAHDLKTPLTIIQGNADLVSETELNEEQRLYVRYIISSSEQMQLYIKSLIDISRAATGYQLHIERMPFLPYLDKIISGIDALCKSNGMKLDIEVDDIPECISVDCMLFERAIMNVVNNAIEHSPDNGTIYFSVKSDKNCLRFCIADEGNGFSKESLIYAKEQFYMSERSRNSDMHFGMGLYIADTIVKMHGGSLVLKNSETKKGAVVEIEIIYNFQ